MSHTDKHHLVCRRCGAVEDVDCAVGHAACQEPAERLGYVIDQAEVTFWGLCAVCRYLGIHANPPRAPARPGWAP